MATFTGPFREIRDGALAELDNALQACATGPLLHLSQDDRLRDFEANGPPIWAVAAAPQPGGTLYVTYGLSEAVDPARRGHDFELTMRVPGTALEWPALLLRAMAHDMRRTQRDRGPGEIMTFELPSNRAFPSTTRMNAVLFTEDPLLPPVSGKHGTTRLIRAVGLYPEELRFVERWSVQGYLQALARYDTALWTDPVRPPLTGERSFVDEMTRGSRVEGSAFEHVCAPGVGWTLKGDEVRLELSAEAWAVLHHMLPARLPFGRRLVLMDADFNKTRHVVFVPATQGDMFVEGDALILEVARVEDVLEGFRRA